MRRYLWHEMPSQKGADVGVIVELGSNGYRYMSDI